MSFDIVPTNLAVTAMRDNGYKNPAYAIAELIDNSIQAGATRVELLCGEKKVSLARRTRFRISEIAVLDNGKGMDAEVLRIALQFGNGTYLDRDNHTGIGRFGMGLPGSSISQCRRVEVWTWQNGVENALYSYIDLDEIEAGKLSEVPTPEGKPVPKTWHEVGEAFDHTGTLVVWSKIDRCLWKTARAIIDNSEFLIGRMYRRFLADDKVRIRLVSFDMGAPNKAVQEDYARANDPLYLMPNTSCPGFPPDVANGEPMFEQWGEDKVFHIRFDNQVHTVTVRFAYAKEEARQGYNPGAEPHGKHAAKNVGVSILRAGRELDLDPAWSDPSEPRDRWWGVEVEFPPLLDDVFGVTNNKQSARYFSELAKVNLESLLEEGQTLGAFMDELDADEDPRAPLLEIAHAIRTNVDTIRRLLRAQTAGTSHRRRRDNGRNIPEAKATEATKKRREAGHSGESDLQETQMPPETRESEIRDELVQQGVMKIVADELAASTVLNEFKYTFVRAALDSPAFFNVKVKGGAIIISLNTNHPAYDHLIEVLEENSDGADEDELRMRLSKASDGLKLLLSAWARYEDEQATPESRDRVKGARWDWGRMARDFLRGEE